MHGQLSTSILSDSTSRPTRPQPPTEQISFRPPFRRRHHLCPTFPTTFHNSAVDIIFAPFCVTCWYQHIHFLFVLREIWILLLICAFIFLYITSYRSDWSARCHAGADSLFAQFWLKLFVLKQPCTAFQPILTISTQTTSHGQDLQMTIFLSRASLHCPPRSKVNV